MDVHLSLRNHQVTPVLRENPNLTLLNRAEDPVGSVPHRDFLSIHTVYQTTSGINCYMFCLALGNHTGRELFRGEWHGK